MNIDGLKILLLNSDKNELSIIKEYMKSLSLDSKSFEDPNKALLAIKNQSYDLVLVSYKISGMNGLDFIKAFRHEYSDVPIIMLTNDIGLQEKALKLGAYDCLSQPLSPVLFQAKVQNALKHSKAELFVQNETLLLEESIKEATQTSKDNEQEALRVLAKVTEYKEHKMNNHTLRVAHCCKLLAKLAGLNEKIQDIAFHASQFYDIGKLSLPDEILLKPRQLDKDELEIMKSHARAGYDLFKYSQSAYLKAGAVISYSHHEKFDGSGYPIGLSGETIPILGRIVSIIDVFEALTSQRSYRSAWSTDDACKFLIDEKGKHFDPNLIDLFIQNIDEINSIRSLY
jgi:two-component system, response regulator RpfG